MSDFTPFSATIGGVLIGLAAGMLWLMNGRIAGISGLFGGLLPVRAGNILWRIVFLAALPIGAIIGTSIGPSLFAEISAEAPVIGLGPFAAIAAGVLVGVGTRLGGGCTSGHGICGLARLSRRSAIAVAVFMAVAIATVFVARHVL